MASIHLRLVAQLGTRCQKGGGGQATTSTERLPDGDEDIHQSIRQIRSAFGGRADGDNLQHISVCAHVAIARRPHSMIVVSA